MAPFPSEKLLDWFSSHQRKLPWRTSYEPYSVWISEVMAQQTRIDQMLPYYEKFLAQFPTVKTLADADEQKVLKAWEGLGYYSRARNLQTAAKQVVEKFGGKIPSKKEELLSLKGFGPYISSAVASIAFNENEVVVDGNVFRVMSRFWGAKEDVSLPATRKLFESRLLEILPKGKARAFNQGLMELGALVCTPDSPACGECPLQQNCFAFSQGKQKDFPVKAKKKKAPQKHFAAVQIANESKLLLFPRKQKLLQGMFEFPMVEFSPLSDSSQTIEKKFHEEWGLKVKLEKSAKQVSHQYSHFTQHVTLFPAMLENPVANEHWVEKKKISLLPLSRVQQKLLEK